jgi:hypothetical protein
MNVRDLFEGCYVTTLPVDTYWTVQLADTAGRILSSRVCLSIDEAATAVHQWLTILDDDAPLVNGSPVMQEEVVSLLREAIVSTVAGEQSDIPHALAALIEREHLRGWFQT